MKKIPDLRPYAGSERWIAKPFTVVDIRDQVWNVVTDRAWLVAIRGRGVYPRWSGDMAQLNIVLTFIQSARVEPRIVKTDVLRSWAASGEVGSVMGVTLDLKKLGKLLDLIPMPYIQMWDARSVTRQDPCLGIATAMDIKAFLMGRTSDGSTPIVFDTMRFTREPQPDKPDKPPPPEWDAFDLAMSLDDDQ